MPFFLVHTAGEQEIHFIRKFAADTEIVFQQALHIAEHHMPPISITVVYIYRLYRSGLVDHYAAGFIGLSLFSSA